VLAYARTAAGAAPVVVVVNNTAAPVSLAGLPGGGVEVAGLLPDGATVEVTGATAALTVASGRLVGTVPAVTALAVAAAP
jgi:hypothetical protein